MNRTAALLTKWLGGLLLLLVPYILVCGYWAPRGVQFLNPVVCAKGEHLDNHGLRVSGGDTDSIELTCRGGGQGIVNATRKVVSVCGVLIVLAGVVLMLSRRLEPRGIAGPRHLPPH